jgi:hypothetical protein
VIFSLTEEVKSPTQILVAHSMACMSCAASRGSKTVCIRPFPSKHNGLQADKHSLEGTGKRSRNEHLMRITRAKQNNEQKMNTAFTAGREYRSRTAPVALGSIKRPSSCASAICWDPGHFNTASDLQAGTVRRIDLPSILITRT